MTKTEKNMVLRFAIVIAMAVLFAASAMTVAACTGEVKDGPDTQHIDYQLGQTIVADGEAMVRENDDGSVRKTEEALYEFEFTAEETGKYKLSAFFNDDSYCCFGINIKDEDGTPVRAGGGEFEANSEMEALFNAEEGVTYTVKLLSIVDESQQLFFRIDEADAAVTG